MYFEFEYKTGQDMLDLIEFNSDKYLIGCKGRDDGKNVIVFTDIPPLIETIKSVGNKISILEAEQEKQNEEILVNMLANTEMFEMILGMTPTTLSIEDENTKNNGGSKMVEVYCTLIIKNVKTIEDVPLVIREQVIERLKQLEVPVK